MEQFQLKDITFCLNEANLEQEIYISVAIGAGFTPSEIRVGEENLSIGSAAAKVFSNYIQENMKNKHNIHLTCVGSMKATCFIWKTTKDTYTVELQLIIQELYEKEIDEKVLFAEKEATIERYKKNYKSLEFRGWMKMQEFAHHNKSFELEQLSQDLLDVDVSIVETMRRYMFVPNNTFIFIHGLANKTTLEQLIIPALPPYEVTYLFNVNNHDFLQNQHYVKQSKGNFTCRSMKFERNPVLTDLAKEYVILNLIGEIMHGDSFIVEVDAMDASIVYDEPRTDQLDSLQTLITEELVLKAKKSTYEQLNKELLRAPEQFMEKVSRLYVNHIHYFECLSHLDEIKAKDIQDFLTMRDYRIREGTVRFYKEAKDHVVS